MGREAFVIRSRADRDKAHATIDRIPCGYRVEFKEQKRTHDQNDRLWEMLTRASKRLTINGATFEPEQWKAIFMQAMGRQVTCLPSLDGRSFFPVGFRSSDLSVREMSDLQTFIESEAAARGVDLWSEE